MVARSENCAKNLVCTKKINDQLDFRKTLDIKGWLRVHLGAAGSWGWHCWRLRVARWSSHNELPFNFLMCHLPFVAALPWWFSPGIPIAVRTWSPVYVMYWPEKHDRFHQLVKQGHVTPMCMWYTPCDRVRVWWVAVIWAWHDEVEAKHNKERFPTHVCKLQIMQTLQPFSVGKTKDATLAVVNDH